MKNPMIGFRAAAIPAVAFVCMVLSTLVPTDDYQRWQVMQHTEYDTLQTIYERIHFDKRPVDVVILGPSKTAVGFSVDRLRALLLPLTKPAAVVNFSVMAAGRNKDYEILKEVLKTKTPKVIILGVDPQEFAYGHSTFKYFASTSSIIFTPGFALHNYAYDLAYLPYRQLSLFWAFMFPSLSNLHRGFDGRDYHRRINQDMSNGFLFHGKWVDTKVRADLNQLNAKRWRPKPIGRLDRLLRVFNDGDNKVYIKEIAKLACAYNIRLVFVNLPEFGAAAMTDNRDFYRRLGTLVDIGNLSGRSDLYMEPYHFNRYGASIASSMTAPSVRSELSRKTRNKACQAI